VSRVWSQSVERRYGNHVSEGASFVPFCDERDGAVFFDILSILLRFRPNQAHISNIYDIAGGDGEFQVGGGDRSRVTRENTAWLDVVWAAICGETIYTDTYDN